MRNFKYPVIFALVSGVASIAVVSCKTHFPKSNEEYKVKATSYSMERGKNLAMNVCGQCHYDREAGKLIGERMNDLPHFMGKIYSANLTKAAMHGVTIHYTDAELAYLIKTGITREGRYIPYMIRPTMADADVNDIIYYLRSDDEPVQPSEAIPGKTHLSAFGKLAMKFSGKPQPYNTGIVRPSEDDPIATGRYLVDIMGCYHCHSKSILKLNYLNPEMSKGYMAGGMKWKIDGTKIHASNLTPDKETGIGNYTKDGFRTAVREGKTPDGRTLHYPMRRFKHLTDAQADAIFTYLQKVPARHHQVKGH